MTNKSILINLVSIISLLLSLEAYSVETNSEKFKVFNIDSKERQQFIAEQNSRVNLRLKNSINFKNIKTSFKSYGTEFTLQEQYGKNGKKYALYDRGMGKPNELVETTPEGESKVIFTSLLLSRNNKYNAMSFNVSPSQDEAVIFFSYKGSTDGFKYITIDLATYKVLYQSADFALVVNPERGVLFKDNNSLIGESSDKLHPGVIAISIDSDALPQMILENAEIKEVYEGLIHAVSSDKENFLITAQKVIKLANYENFSILKRDTKFLYFQSFGINREASKVSFYKYQFDTEEVVKILETDFVPNEVHFLNKFIVLEESIGFTRSLYAYDFDAKEISKINIPFCCQVLGIEEVVTSPLTPVDSLLLSLSSPLVISKSFNWNLNEINPTIPVEFANQMLESSDLVLVVEERFTKSFDGTLIPFRVVYKKGLELLNRPVYMEVYGGFNYPGYLANRLNKLNLDFIRHGGVYVGPALRGGSEYGDAWHEAGVKEKKQNTFSDLAAVAKKLIDSGLTTKDKIVISGSSNGGLTVASTALLYPQYFGLAIPHNGVLDMLGKEELDTRFDSGWSFEYGDSRIANDHEYLEKYSPVELMSQVVKPPNFLILNGRTDTRVNPAHSIKLAAVGKSSGNSNIELVSLNNSGHFNSSIAMSDYIGWRLLTIKWATIYDFLNIVY